MFTLVIVYKDLNLPNDEIKFEDKATAEYFQEYYNKNDYVAYAKIIPSQVNKIQMNIEEKVKILEESKIQIEKALKEQKIRAIKATEKEAEYRKELAKEMYRLKELKMPATLIGDIARGNLSELRKERDLAEIELKAANLYIKHQMQQVETLRTLISYSKAEINIL